MRLFASTAVRYRSVILAVVCIASIWFAFHAASLRMNPDLLSYLPQDDEEVRFFQETAQRFKVNQINMVALTSDDIFTYPSLNDLRKITRTTLTIKGVRHVMSLTNLLDIGREPGGVTVVRPLIDSEAVPQDPEALSALRSKVLANPMLAGSLVSEDGRAAMVTLILDPEADGLAVARKIREAVIDALPDRRIDFNGLAMVQDSMQTLVTRDMRRLMPLTALAILLVLSLGTGGFRGVVLPLSTVILAMVWSLGTLSLAGMQLSMLTAVIPVVVMVLGATPGIYLIVRYYEEEGVAGKERAEHVLAKESVVLLRTGLVILAGFLSLMLSDLAMFREFGKAAAFAIFWSFALSLTFLPACLAYLPSRPARTASLASPEGRLASAAFSRLAAFVLNRKPAIRLLAAVLCLAALALIPGIPRHMNMMSYFPRGSEPYNAEELMKGFFGGSQLVQVNFRSGDVRAPVILEQMELLEKRLRLIPDVHYPQSLADVLKELNWNLNGEPGLPDSMDKIHNMWFLLEGQPAIELLADTHFANGVVGVRIGDSDPAVVARAVAGIRTAVEETVPKDLFLVELGKQPPSARRALEEELAARIARKVALDVKFHTGGDLPEKDLAAALAPILQAQPTLDSSDRKVLQERIEAFLGTEEADIRIDETAQLSGLAERLALEEHASSSSLETALRETLPPSSWEGDAEDLAYTADFLRILFQQRFREKRFREALNTALGFGGLSAQGSDHPQLRKDLAANLWGVNNAFLGVDPETWFRITGRERLPWESHVGLDVRVTGLPVINLKYDGILVPAIAKATFNALVISLVLLILVLRSPGYGFAAASPLFLSSLVILGTSSLMGWSVDNMTIFFLSLAAGASVMYALPFIARGAEGLARRQTEQQVLEGALSTRGRAILINTLAFAMGFLVLLFSSIAPLRQFGLFIAMALVLGNIGTFFILPALMLRRKRKKT